MLNRSDGAEGSLRRIVVLTAVVCVCLGAAAAWYWLRYEQEKPIPPSLNMSDRPEPYTTAEVDQMREAARRQAENGESLLPLFDTNAAKFNPAWLELKPTDVVADIGCGTGAAEVAVVEARVPFARWYLVEVHRPTAALAKHLISRAAPSVAARFEVKLTSTEEVQLPADSVDVMFMVNLRLAMPRLASDAPLSRGRVKRMMDSIHRVLRPGARLHLFEPTIDKNEQPYPMDQLVQNYLNHGFKVVKHQELVLHLRFHHVVLAAL